MCMKWLLDYFDSQITTLILNEATMTRSNLRALLSLRSLRSVRFIKVKAAVDDEDEDDEQELDGTLRGEVRLCFNLRFNVVM